MFRRKNSIYNFSVITVMAKLWENASDKSQINF